MFENTETAELTDRYRTLIVDYKSISEDLVRCLERYGKVRKELQILLDEFNKRKINIDEIEVIIKNEDTDLKI